MNENIEALKILINISKNLHTSKKSNYSRIKNNKLFNEKGKDKLINQVINPLDLALLEVGNEISRFLETIPIYNIFLRHVNGINLYDSAESVCEIKDIKNLIHQIIYWRMPVCILMLKITTKIYTSCFWEYLIN